MVNEFRDCDRNAAKFSLLACSVVSLLISMHSVLITLIAGRYTQAVVDASLRSNDANVWGVISSVIDTGGFIKGLNLEFQIAYIVVSFVSLYLSVTLLNMLLKGIPLSRLISKQYWLKFYNGGVMYDEVLVKSNRAKPVTTKQKAQPKPSK